MKDENKEFQVYEFYKKIIEQKLIKNEEELKFSYFVNDKKNKKYYFFKSIS